MKFALRIAMLLPLLLAACAGAPAGPPQAEPTRLQPVALRLTVTGKTEPVLDLGTTGQIELVAAGADEPVVLDFENGTLATHELPPGQYSVTRIGPLACRELTFELDPSASARALGSLQAEIIATDYYVALLSRQPATTTDIDHMTGQGNGAAGDIDARPISAPATALCHVGRNGESRGWDDLPLEEKIMVGAVIAGFCALALSAGGFCMF